MTAIPKTTSKEEFDTIVTTSRPHYDCPVARRFLDLKLSVYGPSSKDTHGGRSGSAEKEEAIEELTFMCVDADNGLFENLAYLGKPVFVGKCIVVLDEGRVAMPVQLFKRVALFMTRLMDIAESIFPQFGGSHAKLKALGDRCRVLFVCLFVSIFFFETLLLFNYPCNQCTSSALPCTHLCLPRTIPANKTPPTPPTRTDSRRRMRAFTPYSPPPPLPPPPRSTTHPQNPSGRSVMVVRDTTSRSRSARGVNASVTAV